MQDSYQEIFSDKTRILAVFAHPDDAEIYAGGLIARLIKDGKKVRVVKVTSGNKGSRQQIITEEALKKVRMTENADSMHVLGVTEEDNVYLNLGDGEITNDIKVIELLVKQIRSFKPDLIVTHNPEDIIIRFDKNENWINHRDHRNTGKSVVDASYPYSRDILFFPDQLKDPNISSHKVCEFLFVDYYGHEDEVFFDVSETVELKTKAIACHKSQFSPDYAQDTTDYFTIIEGSDRRWERFRYVFAD